MKKCSAMLQIWVAANIIGLVSSSLTFLNGSLAGSSYNSAPVTQFLGPQSNFTVNAKLVYISDNGCRAAATIGKERVQDRAVYLLNTYSGCNFEHLYDEFAALGAVAVITMDVYIPGGLGYNMHDGTIQYAYTNMLYVQLGYDQQLSTYLSTKQENVYIRVSPDPNQWAIMFQSWPYRICLRWVPAMIFSYSGLMAFYYLYGHIQLGRMKQRSSRHGSCPGSLYDLMQLPTLALLIKMVESVILALNFGMCGMLATTLWPAPAQRYFIQQMSGCTFVTILIAASFWNRILLDVQPTIPSLFKRILIGDVSQCTYLMYMLPIACETFFSISYAKYWVISGNFYKADAGAHALAQFLVGSQFLISAIRFRMEASTILERHEDPKMKAYLNRVSVIVIGLGITCLGYVIGTMMIAIYPAFVTPNGWTLTWSIVTISHALESILLVLLFRPRRSPYTVGIIVSIGSKGTGSSLGAAHRGKPSGNRTTPSPGTNRQ